MTDLEQQRQQIISKLASAYAVDALDMEELERRIECAEQASSSEALVPLVADLTPPSEMAPTSTALVPAEEVPAQRSLITLFSNVKRERSWTVPRRLKVFSLFGGTELDFRQARLAAGTTEIRVCSIMAGVRLLVPPGLPVEVDGVAILGAFEQQLTEQDPQDQPSRLRISGLSLLSGVEVEDRLPQENSRHARRRRKKARQALKAAAADKLLRARRSEDRE